MYLYLLENQDSGVYYIGVTKDIEERVRYHNGSNRHFTGKQHGEWKLMSSKYFSDAKEARKQEKRLKKVRNKQYITWYFTAQDQGA